MIYLDNAATTFPKPSGVVNAVLFCNRNYSVNVGRSSHKLAQKAAETVYETRKKVAQFFGAPNPENVVFTPNCTFSSNYVLKGILKSGDHVICSSMEHNAVLRPLNKLKTKGIQFDTATVFPGNDEATVSAFEALIKDNTKMIVCLHISNVNGQILPIEKIGKLCKKYGIIFAVDAAQSAGILPIDMEKYNIDYLFVAPHKGLYAPMGTGLLIANREIEDTLIEGGTGSLSAKIEQPDFMPDRFESGTVNLSGIAGIGKGIDFVNSKGISNIYKEEMKITKNIYNELSNQNNIIIYADNFKLGNYGPVISFNINGLAAEEAAQILDKNNIAVRSGLHCAPLAHTTLGTLNIGTVRISPSVFTTLKEADYFVNVIKKIGK